MVYSFYSWGFVQVKYNWGITARYRDGRAQWWACNGVSAAKEEYSQLLEECRNGEHPEVSEVSLVRYPVVWEAVETWRFPAQPITPKAG